jgi:deoxycytidylate deaminase
MKRAIALAHTSKYPNRTYRHAAVVMKNGNIISVGTNSYRNNPKVVDRKHCSFHAEIVALKKAGNKAKGSILFVARVGKNNRVALSKPCSSCSEYIKNAGVKKVYWTEEVAA